jgi:myxalamid-type nonribosomal peptide synthetase MxaA
VVPAGGGSEAPTADLLRAHLKSRLPEYMVPAAYVLMEKLPLTANGKLNRRALPAPQQSAYTNRQYQAPQSELEEALAGIWQEVLSVERVGRQDHFFELGGHSLLALQLLVKIHQTLGQGLTVTDIYKSPTLRELAERIMAGAAAEELVDLAKESQLDAELAAQGTECRRVPERALLVTGCTGFVGRFLLAQLLQETDATLYCLVRPQATQQARVRLRAALRKWDLWTPEAERRVVAVPADLSRPKLGLRDGVYEVLAESVDSVYHCATSMNHLETYAMAKAANVEATRDLLKFATQGRPKLINYISTLSVFGEAPGGVARLVTEDTPVDRERHPTSHGYAASKWVSEKMLITAAERGIACNIFRLGLVWADAQHGRYDELQREYRLIKSCLSAGVGIEDYGYGMAPLPVDYVARAILALARQSPRGGGIYHLASCEQPAGGLFERCNELAEVSLDLLPQYEWIGAIKRLHDAGVPLPVVPLIEFAFPMTEAAFDEYCREADSPGTRFDCSRTLRALEQAGMAAPRWSVDLLEKCVVGMISRDAELQRLLETQSRTARRKYA